MTPSSRSCQPVDPRSVYRCAGKKGGRFHRGRLPRLCIGTPDIEDLATRTRAVPVGFGLLSVDQHQMLPAVLAALFGFYQENLQQDQAEAQSASTIKSALRMKRWRRLFPIAKPSLLLSVACAARRAGRGNAARSRLYFVGYVTAPPTKVGGFQSLATHPVQPHSYFSRVRVRCGRQAMCSKENPPGLGSALLPTSDILRREGLLPPTAKIRLSRGMKPSQDYEAHHTAEAHSTANIRHSKEAALRRPFVTMNLNPNRNLVASGTAPGEPRRRPCFENDFTSQIFS
jgi:hypothetical protein